MDTQRLRNRSSTVLPCETARAHSPPSLEKEDEEEDEEEDEDVEEEEACWRRSSSARLRFIAWRSDICAHRLNQKEVNQQIFFTFCSVRVRTVCSYFNLSDRELSRCRVSRGGFFNF